MIDEVAVVRRQVSRFIKKAETLEGTSAQKAMLAEWRRGVGKRPGEWPTTWGMLLESLPPELMSVNNGLEPTKAEWAIYLAQTLYALHQQGKSVAHENMHKPGLRIGGSVARLVKGEDDIERVLRRFNMMATAESIEELSHHLRGIVQLLRAEGIGTDYEALAGDLYYYQVKGQEAKIRLSWGESFYGEIYAGKTKDLKGEENG